jgi:hypothetical protein
MKYKYLIKLCIFVYFSIVLFSCSKYKEILPDVAKTKIIIYINEGNYINEDDYFLEITDINEIKIVSKYISNIPSPMYKCGYNGKMEFYCKNNNLLFDTEFNIDCNTIVFVYDDKIYNRRISKDGINYIAEIIKEIDRNKMSKEILLLNNSENIYEAIIQYFEQKNIVYDYWEYKNFESSRIKLN